MTSVCLSVRELSLSLSLSLYVWVYFRIPNLWRSDLKGESSCLLLIVILGNSSVLEATNALDHRPLLPCIKSRSHKGNRGEREREGGKNQKKKPHKQFALEFSSGFSSQGASELSSDNSELWTWEDPDVKCSLMSLDETPCRPPSVLNHHRSRSMIGSLVAFGRFAQRTKIWRDFELDTRLRCPRFARNIVEFA
jgi:hypothetical protein